MSHSSPFQLSDLLGVKATASDPKADRQVVFQLSSLRRPVLTSMATKFSRGEREVLLAPFAFVQVALVCPPP
jgi:hypothetical protein